MAPIESFGFEAQFLRKPPFTIEFGRRWKAKSVKIPAEYGSIVDIGEGEGGQYVGEWNQAKQCKMDKIFYR